MPYMFQVDVVHADNPDADDMDFMSEAEARAKYPLLAGAIAAIADEGDGKLTMRIGLTEYRLELQAALDETDLQYIDYSTLDQMAHPAMIMAPFALLVNGSISMTFEERPHPDIVEVIKILLADQAEVKLRDQDSGEILVHAENGVIKHNVYGD